MKLKFLDPGIGVSIVFLSMGVGARQMDDISDSPMGRSHFLSRFTYKISDTIELKSSIFSLVIVFRAGWSFPSTTGSAKEWKRWKL